MIPAHYPHQANRWHDLVDLLTAIRGRAQATRRRVERVDRLSRDHIAGDLAQIEARADRLAELLLAPPGIGECREEVAMDERDREPQPDQEEAKGPPPERRGRDGGAGAGDMLGGLGTGAGDRLGPDDAEDEDRASPNQHSFAGEEFATDTARHYHGPDEPV